MTALATTDRVRLAAFRLDRLSGVSATALELSAAVREQLERHRVAAEAAGRAAELLTDAVFPLVPQAGRAERRRLLKLKRLVHQGAPVTSADLEFLARAGVPQDLLTAWSARCDQLAAGRGALERAVDDASARAAETLREQLTDGPLALALPLVATHLPPELTAAQLRPGSRLARTGLLYLIRAALKPSPLSRLTTVSLHPSAGPGRSESDVPVGFAHSLFAELAATEAFTGVFDYAPAPRVATFDGHAAVVTRTLSDTGGFLWSGERIVQAELYRAELDQLLAAGAALPAARLVRYVRMGLLMPVVPWVPGSRTPLLDLAAALRAGGAGGPVRQTAEEIAAGLTALHHAARAVAAAGAAERRALLPAVREQADELARRCGAPAWAGQLVHEDTATADPVGPLPAAVAEDLTALAESLRPCFVRSHVYDLVLERFRGRHGAGGRCADAVAFFTALAEESGFKSALHQARMRDLAPAEEQRGRDRLPVGRTSAPPAVAVLHQLAAADAAAARGGDYRMVVNQLGSALGGLLTRFGRVLGEQAVEQAQLPWLRELFPGCEVRALTLAGQVNNLQHAGAGVLPGLHWPGEQQRRGQGSLGFDELALRHDPEHDTLEFEDQAGRPVAPVYTGIVPAHICTGAAQLALSVMDPWLDRSELSRDNHPFLRVQAMAGITEVVATGRVTAGRVVLRRARWLVPADRFPAPRAGEATVDHLVRLDRWRRELGLPHEVFLLALGGDPMDADRRKPVWLDLASPHAVATALPLIAGAHTLRIEEALPARGQAWIAGGDGPRMCEHVHFLSWDRPDGAQR
ncbi:hypothetical protein ABT095_20570 [Kitasatospora sp. NPDC002227]|uniref:hypothetical protein n=1 Tax=Kitasatospora sp. NPDC002227 TaxID=3154773 RepID=UPI00331F611D